MPQYANQQRSQYGQVTQQGTPNSRYLSHPPISLLATRFFKFSPSSSPAQHSPLVTRPTPSSSPTHLPVAMDAFNSTAANTALNLSVCKIAALHHLPATLAKDREISLDLLSQYNDLRGSGRQLKRTMPARDDVHGAHAGASPVVRQGDPMPQQRKNNTDEHALARREGSDEQFRETLLV